MSRRRALFLAFRTVQFAVLFGIPALFVGEGAFTWSRYGIVAAVFGIVAAVHHRVEAAARVQPDRTALLDTVAALEAGAIVWLLWTTWQWSNAEPLFASSAARYLVMFAVLFQLKRRRLRITWPPEGPPPGRRTVARMVR
jgi:hypothetical protein